ncbi:hypothetical protein DQW50_08070 [Halorubrum sp. 48-1-W]|uniref:hypothetical protein n=1 Tax=Halorubrum sp. 48-1-W TaxID=2249761 RepID=UPI000DCEF982|nr:hypothetical protein [Halorubrum sp. 48-1-W]RAW45691.1 hypothetical protein DQW50_08070 [Halorubrum sp. 48-1-W]
MARDIGEAATTRRDAVGHGAVVGAGVSAARPVGGTGAGPGPATTDVSPGGFDETEPSDRGTLADALDRGTLADALDYGTLADVATGGAV